MAVALIPRVGCIILAAGEARRFGGGKLTARAGGVPLLQRAIDAACGSRALHCTLVVGAGAARVIAQVDTRRCRVIVNRDWRRGIATSLASGIRSAADDDACIIALGDQPNVTSLDLNGLIDASVAAGKARVPSIVALRAGAVWGAPVLFPRRDFPALRRLRGDQGAKRIAAANEKRLRFVDAAHDDAFEDIDTREDLTRLNARGILRTHP
ncbi:MAG: nucleotidyltransferase family protein [Candidatus Eremiobacteraeota bacterium]|nr:nucleotidyltransferase family protein [Candidatus Eremiobacteraeota bacterium]MBV8366037.1 nucleotidyltransferase family protein [Candidatus Eremiobacteraeota bacterium]